MSRVTLVSDPHIRVFLFPQKFSEQESPHNDRLCKESERRDLEKLNPVIFFCVNHYVRYVN